MKSFTFTLRASCRKCGDPLPVNGPLHSTVCENCFADNKLTPAIWAMQIAAADEGSRILNNPYICLPADTRDLHCPGCEKPFPIDRDLLGKDTVQTCPHCKAGIMTFPAPRWMKKELPRSVQVFCTERDEDEHTKKEISLPAIETGGKPIVFSCPSCGAGLKAGVNTERFIPCGHCDSEVYIPDLIWKRLHPVRVMQPWTIVYEGRSTLQSAE